jgi:hypothetical protein
VRRRVFLLLQPTQILSRKPSAPLSREREREREERERERREFSLSIHCPFTVHSLSIHCPVTVRDWTVNDNKERERD